MTYKVFFILQILQLFRHRSSVMYRQGLADLLKVFYFRIVIVDFGSV
jgi:hypothetical protein